MLAVFLLFGVLQVAVYFYVRNVVSASAAAGARAAANADVEPALGAALAQDRIRTSLGSAAAKEVRCTAENTTDDPSGLLVVSVRCVGRIHTSFFPAGEFLELDVRSRALKEGR